MNSDSSVLSGFAIEIKDLQTTTADTARELSNYSEVLNLTKDEDHLNADWVQPATNEEEAIEDHQPTSQIGDDGVDSSSAADGHTAPSGPSRPMWDETMPEAPDISENATIWKTYLMKADEFDAALIDKWSKSIDVFLLFTGLFSAILSAFIVVSWSNLQPDSTQATVDGLVAVSQQLVLLSAGQPLSPSTAYQPQPFVAPWTALVVNFLWFISLFISLLAAVLGMLVKEWLSMYDDNKEVEPLARVQQRQLRHDGLHTWIVPGLSRALPISIHIAVMLFLTGLAIFVQPASLALSWTLTCLLVGGFCLWITSAVIPLIRPDCPYKSPLSAAFREAGLACRKVPSPFSRLSPLLGMGMTSPFNLKRGTLLPDQLESRERASIRTRTVELQASALAWLCKSPDPAVQKAALLVLSWWRMPNRLWKTFGEDVGNAAVSFMRGQFSQQRLPSDGQEILEKPKNLELGQLETMALIAVLVPKRTAFDHVSVQTLVKRETYLSYRYFLAESIRLRLHSKFPLHFYPMAELSVFLACSRLEAAWSGAVLQPPMGRRDSLPEDPLWELRQFGRYSIQGNLPQTVFIKHTAVLGLVTHVDEPECSLSCNAWMSRYPTGASREDVARLLLACVRRLYSSDPFPGWPERRTSAVSLAFLQYAVHQQDFVYAGSQADIHTTLCAVTQQGSGSSMAAGFSVGRTEEVTSLLATALLEGTKSLDTQSFIAVLRYIIQCSQDRVALYHAFENCFWRSFESLSSWHSFPWAVEFLESDMVPLLSKITEHTVALLVPALLLSHVALRRNPERSTNLLIYMNWLACFSKYGLDYFSPPQQTRSSEPLGRHPFVRRMVQQVLEDLLFRQRKKVLAFGVVQEFCRREECLIRGWTQEEQDQYMQSLQMDETIDAVPEVQPESGQAEGSQGHGL